MIYENIETAGVSYAKTTVGKRKMDKICDVALKLFHDNGFMHSQVLDICSAAGMAVGTFYIYFEDKLALFTYLVNNGKYALLDYVKKQIQQTANSTFEDRARKAIRAYMEFFIDNPYMHSAIWGSIALERAVFEDFIHSVIDKLYDYFRGGLDKQKYDTLAYFVLGGVNLTITKLRLVGAVTNKDIDNAVEQTIRVVKSFS